MELLGPGQTRAQPKSPGTGIWQSLNHERIKELKHDFCSRDVLHLCSLELRVTEGIRSEQISSFGVRMEDGGSKSDYIGDLCNETKVQRADEITSSGEERKKAIIYIQGLLRVPPVPSRSSLCGYAGGCAGAMLDQTMSDHSEWLCRRLCWIRLSRTKPDKSDSGLHRTKDRPGHAQELIGS
jgi:hypothetical protein